MNDPCENCLVSSCCYQSYEKTIAYYQYVIRKIKEKQGFDLKNIISYEAHVEIQSMIKSYRSIKIKSKACGWTVVINTVTEEVIEVTGGKNWKPRGSGRDNASPN